ncbi:hypothetical protein GGQ65_001136 [Rhizobium fabae]|uniref:Uncharacterized protein n=1 Tax=Rhizobium fabae TaxID=573179 RepID=A0A7W6FHD6_9HYPH|nr:hypothetical protein [Rhizobium fabae]
MPDVDPTEWATITCRPWQIALQREVLLTRNIML